MPLPVSLIDISSTVGYIQASNYYLPPIVIFDGVNKKIDEHLAYSVFTASIGA